MRAVRGLLLSFALGACWRAAPAPAVASHEPAASAKATAPAPSAACADLEGDVTRSIPESEAVAALDPDRVRSVMDGRAGELRRCYQRYLKRDTRSGKVVATFAVRPNGSVAKVQLQGFSGAFDRCVCDVVAHARFAAPGATAIVRYPMLFVPSS